MYVERCWYQSVPSTVQENVGCVCVAEDREYWQSGVDVDMNSLGLVNATVF